MFVDKNMKMLTLFQSQYNPPPPVRRSSRAPSSPRRTGDANLLTAVRFKTGVANYFHYDALMRHCAVEDSAGTTYYTWGADGLCPLLARTPDADSEERFARGFAPSPARAVLHRGTWPRASLSGAVQRRGA